MALSTKPTLREFLAHRLGQDKIPYTVIDGVIYEIGHGGLWVDAIIGTARLNIRRLEELDFHSSPIININSTDPSLQLRRLSDAIDDGEI